MRAFGLWLWGVIRAFWWVLLLIIGAVLVIGFVRRNKKAGEAIEEAAAEKAPSFVKVASERVQDALTDVKVEQAIIKERASAKKEQLEEIRKEPDGKERRKRLAKVLSASI